MDLTKTSILAIIQGLTEFLPISSSAHLILLPKLTGWDDQGLAFDVAVHFGTLLAVLAYFKKDLINLGRAWFGSIIKGQHTLESKLAWGVGIATIPVGAAGFIFKSFIENNLRSAFVISVATIIFGLLLGTAAIINKNSRDEYTLTIKDILFIGCAQVLALIPGTSRSGITMTAGLMLGLSKQAAARFSFLLAIPVIISAGGLMFLDLIKQPLPVAWHDIILGVGLSFVTAYLCIKMFMQFIEKVGFGPFVIYRILLGIFLLSFL